MVRRSRSERQGSSIEPDFAYRGMAESQIAFYKMLETLGILDARPGSDLGEVRMPILKARRLWQHLSELGSVLSVRIRQLRPCLAICRRKPSSRRLPWPRLLQRRSITLCHSRNRRPSSSVASHQINMTLASNRSETALALPTLLSPAIQRHHPTLRHPPGTIPEESLLSKAQQVTTTNG
jgi:hypothetical protein